LNWEDHVKISKNPMFEINRFNIDEEILQQNIFWWAKVAHQHTFLLKILKFKNS
jgi:hypothetical protein